jgi:hypothetical protein
MTNGVAAQIGPGMNPDEEAAHKKQLAEMYADQAEKDVTTIEAKLAGMKESLATAKTVAKALRAEANKGGAS